MNIKRIYKKIFQYHGNINLEERIQKIIELDTILPYNSTFFCVTNTQMLTFEFVSKNLTALLGYTVNEIKNGGMKFFWSKIHPDDVEHWIKSLQELMNFTMDEIETSERNKMNYTWNYRLKNAQGNYVNIIQNTTPLEFDNQNKPIVGLAHYTVLSANIKLDICASAKYLNDNNEYETKYFNNFSQKLLSDGITNRERDIIRLLVLNKSSKDIAEKLHISSNTVDTHRRNILKKMNISSTGELIGILKNNPVTF